MNLWNEAFDALSKVEREEADFTVDQRLKAAEIKALLAIGQDLNALRLKDEEAF
jgi:hypothetical protein